MDEKQDNNPFIICDRFLRNGKNVYLIGGPWKDKFLETLKFMDDFAKAKDEGKSTEDMSYTPIEECLNFLKCLTVEKQKSPEFDKFLKAFVYLAHNINQNHKKYEGVTKKINYLQRYADNALTFNETLSLMNNISERVANWNDWTPPSFRLSRHYYNLLKEE